MEDQGVRLPYLLASILGLWLCLWQTAQAVEMLPLEMAFAPAEQNFSPEQAHRLAFQPYVPDTPLNQGGREPDMVLRLELPGDMGLAGEKVLVVQPHYFRRVTAWFKYRENPRWKASEAGRLLSSARHYYSTRNLVFEIDRDLDPSFPVYLHIQDTGGAKPVRVSLADRRAYLDEDVAFSRHISMLYGMIFVLALINLIFYYFIREKPFLLYSIYMFLALNALFWQEGWIGKYISFSDLVWADRGLHFFTVLPVLAFYAFYWSYLELSRKSRSGRFMLAVQMAVLVILVGSLLESLLRDTYVRHLWDELVNGVLVVGSLGIFVITFLYWIRGHRLAGYLFVANMVLVSATLMRIYYAFNFQADGYWLAHAFELALAVDAILLSLALADRTLSIKRERDKARVDLERVDTAYKRQRLLAEFVREAQSLAAAHEGRDFTEQLDRLMYHSVNRILDVRSVVLLSHEAGEVRQRNLGGDRILSRLFSGMIERNLPQLLENCHCGKMLMDDMTGYPDLKESYKYLLIPVRIREHRDCCVLLLIPCEEALEQDLVYGLREFVEKAVHARMEAESMEKLRRLARYDDLTGVFNRASMEMHISRLLEQCSEGGRGLSLAFVDVDHFKQMNDSMGHDYGDQCLRMLCRAMCEILPGNALIGRFGGDEFLVLLPGEDYFHATEILARLNPFLQKQTRDREMPLSVSVGIGECPSGRRMSMAELIKKADLSLYAAKAAGRGCIGARVG